MARRDVNVFEILDAQLADVSDSDTPIRMIPLADIHPNPRNFYPKVENLDDLVESIQANGLLEPLTVVPDEKGGYRLISGHHSNQAGGHHPEGPLGAGPLPRPPGHG